MTKSKALFILTLLSLSPLTAGPAGKESFVIEPGVRVGPVGSKTSEADLRKILGEGAVQPTQIGIGEGEEVPGTRLFPSDPTRTAEIIWKDPGTRMQPKTVIIRGRQSQWRTAEGITLGTSLAEIEKLNRGPFNMAGFEWDYSGTVTDCADGRLKFLGVNRGTRGIEGRSLVLRLEPPEERVRKLSVGEYETVVGGQIFSSQNNVMQRLNPLVYEIVAELP